MSLLDLKNRIVDAIAAPAQHDYVSEFNDPSNPDPTNPERMNSAGQRVNYKVTHDTRWIEEERKAGRILTGIDAIERPVGAIIEVEGNFLVDLGNREYNDLPDDLKALNQSSAKVAVNELINGAIAVHDAWVLANSYLIEGVSGNDRIYKFETPKEIYAFVLLCVFTMSGLWVTGIKLKMLLVIIIFMIVIPPKQYIDLYLN